MVCILSLGRSLFLSKRPEIRLAWDKVVLNKPLGGKLLPGSYSTLLKTEQSMIDVMLLILGK